MKINKVVIVILSFFISIATSHFVFAANRNLDEMYNAAVAVYEYAYPLVLTDITKDVMTNVPAAEDNARAPLNQFSHADRFATENNKDVIRPNTDTLYSNAWLDLSAEPIILSVPDTQDRYYVLPLLDAWTEVFESIGKRTTGTLAGHFLIVGPSWNGVAPDNMPVIKSPTNTVWITGRTLVTDRNNLDSTHEIQKGYLLTPLSQWGKAYTPPVDVPINPAIDMVTPPIYQINHMDALTFFQRVATVLKSNPPHAIDREILKQLKTLGINPGSDFETVSLSKAEIHELETAAKHALAEIIAYVPKIGTEANGWITADIIGHYGTAYLDRASIAYAAIGANIPLDAVYPAAIYDETLAKFNGSKRYVMHFSKRDIPPANGFWSLSLYGDDGFIVANELNRYSLGDRSPLSYNPDGSLDIYIQHDSPGNDKESNWLPAPIDKFNLMMRLYWPDLKACRGYWQPPVVKSVT